MGCKAQKLAYLEGQLTTTMITDLLPNFNNPTMRSIEMSTLMVALTGEGCNAPRGFTVSPLCHRQFSMQNPLAKNYALHSRAHTSTRCILDVHMDQTYFWWIMCIILASNDHF